MTVDFAFNLGQRVGIVGTPAVGVVVGLLVDDDRAKRVRVHIVTTDGEDIWPWYREDQLQATGAQPNRSDQA